MRGRRQIYAALILGATVILSAPVVEAQVMFKPVFHRLVSVGAWQESEPQAELLIPKAVVTDQDGRIYVADQGDFTVKVFDKQGEFIHALGRQGQGPGEFLDFESLAVDRNGHLLVSEIRNSRITRFSTEGEVLETMRVSYDSGALSKITTPLENGDYLTLFSSRFRDQQTPIFHQLSADFSEEWSAFGEIGNHGDAAEPFWLTSNGGRPGSFWMESDQKLVYVPYLYEGMLFSYAREDSSWKLAKVLEGVTEREKDFQRTGPAFLSSGGLRDGMKGATHFTQQGRFSAIVYTESQHVFVLNDGRIVHFSQQYIDGAYRLILEVFDTDGTLVGYGRISRLEGADDVNLLLRSRVVWKDDQDQFYLLERSDNPQVHVVSLAY